MPRTIRPNCSKCGMSMIATSLIRDSKQAFECLRCGHTEKRRIENASPRVMKAFAK